MSDEIKITEEGLTLEMIEKQNTHDEPDTDPIIDIPYAEVANG